jgi:hypothetical protein
MPDFMKIVRTSGVTALFLLLAFMVSNAVLVPFIGAFIPVQAITAEITLATYIGLFAGVTVLETAKSYIPQVRGFLD